MTARILVVDDNPLNLKLLAAKLTHDYYIVSTAENGLEALAKIETEKSDIVLLDVMMPELDGFETCRRIKGNAATAHIPVVMVTALSDVADRVRGLEAGADDFLTKPINDLALMARIRSLLRLKLIMDEWRAREVTSNQFIGQPQREAVRNTDIEGSHVLLLEDDPAESDFARHILANLSADITTATTVEEAAALAQSGAYDVVFASLNLKNEDGLLLCAQLRTHEVSRQLPILLVAHDTEMTRVAKGLDIGANDYLLRPLDVNELIARTRTQLKHKRHYDYMRKNYEASLALALVDPLTGAFNRRYLDAHLPKILARCKVSEKPLSVLMVDIDHFKLVNDLHGHDAGDRVLREIVSIMNNNLRPFDLVARMGGEEFAIVMPEIDISMALTIADRLRERIAKAPVSIHGKDRPLLVTVSIGAANLATSEVTVDGVFARADAALYRAKETGRNRVVGGTQDDPHA